MTEEKMEATLYGLGMYRDSTSNDGESNGKDNVKILLEVQGFGFWISCSCPPVLFHLVRSCWQWLRCTFARNKIPTTCNPNPVQLHFAFPFPFDCSLLRVAWFWGLGQGASGSKMLCRKGSLSRFGIWVVHLRSLASFSSTRN